MVERIERIEKKLDDFATSVARRFDDVARRFDSVDRRFDGVDQRFSAVDGEFVSIAAAFAEQRQYTEFAFEKLDAKMDARFDKVDARFDKMDTRFDRLERTLGQFITAFNAPKRGPRRR